MKVPETNTQVPVINKSVTTARVIQNMLLNICGTNIQFIDDPNEAQCLIAVQQDGLVIKYIPEHNRTINVNKAAIQNAPEAIKFIQIKSLEEFCEYLEIDNDILQSVNFNNMPESLRDVILDYLISKDPYYILRTNVEYTSVEMWLAAIEEQPDILEKMSSVEYDKFGDELINQLIPRFPDYLIRSYWIDRMNGQQVKWLIEQRPLDAKRIIEKRSSREYTELGIYAVGIQPSVVSSVARTFEFHEDIFKFYKTAISVYGSIAVEYICESDLHDKHLEDFIVTHFTKYALKKLNYKPKKISNKLRLLFRRY